MRILIMGSTLLTELTVEYIKNEYDLVGHIPSVNPTVRGNVKLPVVDFSVDCDIKLSIQYDKIIKNPIDCYNVHTGLLPEYGGCNILSHTLANNAREQGLTFHKMTDELDYGPIISKITYPVFDGDRVSDLYERQLQVAPSFVLSSLKLLQSIDANNCVSIKPNLYKRADFVLDKEDYEKMQGKAN